MKTEWMTDSDGVKWIKDEKGNKCSVRYFGNEAAAEKALKSLEDCENCSNCSDCSRCSGCSRCSRCSGCSGCSDCSRCSGCSRCSRCSGCSDCSDCSRCSDLIDNKPAKIETLVVPKIENIHQKVYEAVSKEGAFDMGAWHTCETTHCRAGWVVHLAGEDGKKLEAFHDTPLAAPLIYHASSDLPVSMPRFYETDEVAMADIKRLAELEANNPASGRLPE